MLCVVALSLTMSSQLYARADDVRRPPPPPRIKPLQLHQPFTLVYDAAVQWDNHGSPVHNDRRLTLSYDGQNLLYISEDPATKVSRTELYDGSETYTTDSNSGIASIDPGFDFSRFLYCPLPGVGIPNMPLLASHIPARVEARVLGRVAPNVSSEPSYVDKAVYGTGQRDRDFGIFITADRASNNINARNGIASVVTTPAAGAPKVLWYDTFELPSKSYPGVLWEYLKHVSFEGIWLASDIVMRDYNIRQTGDQIYVLIDAKYKLVSAQDHALETSAYDPATYLHKHSNITDFTGPKPRTFLYEPGNGSLTIQRQKEMDVRAATTLAARGSTHTGLIGLCVILVGATIWTVWRRGKG
jgi:hypothetical protein